MRINLNFSLLRSTMIRSKLFLAALFAGIFLIKAGQAFGAAPQATGKLLFAAGKASPQGKLRDYLMPANAYNFNIFGGAKVDLEYIGAVGLGWDFTYSEHKLKNDVKGHYRRFSWDWLHVPLSKSLFYVKPGLSWVLTNVKIPELQVEESSIRPELLFEAGMRVALGSNFGITGGARGEWTWLDTERTSSGKDLAITGNFGSWFAGFILFI